MFVVTLLLLAVPFEWAVSGEPAIPSRGKKIDPGDSVLAACQTLKDEAQDIRHEGYSAIDKADVIREQA